MRVLMICNRDDQYQIIRDLFNEHFPKVALAWVKGRQESILNIREYGGPLFTIIDSTLADESIHDLFLQIAQLTAREPIVFIGSGSAEKKELPPDFYDVNASNGVIKRPIGAAQFIETVKKAMGHLYEGMLLEQPINFNKGECLPMKIRGLYRMEKAQYDVFFEIMEGKFYKVFSKGDPIYHANLNKLARKGVKTLYLKKDDQLNYIDEAIEKLQKTWTIPELSNDNIFVLQITSCGIIHDAVKTVGVTEKVEELTRKIIDFLPIVFKKYGSLQDLLEEFPFHNKDLAEQSVLTMYIAHALLLKMGWGADMSVMKLGLASILHDAFISNDDLVVVTSLNDRNLHMFNAADQDDFVHHPVRAAKIAQEFEQFSDVDFIISQHHELPDGSGFPQGLNSHQITGLSSLFVLANNLVAQICQKGMEREALVKVFQKFDEYYSMGNFKAPLKLLKDLFLK